MSGYPRTKLGKYAHSFRVKLAPLVLSREATQKNSGLCSPVSALAFVISPSLFSVLAAALLILRTMVSKLMCI